MGRGIASPFQYSQICKKVGQKSALLQRSWQQYFPWPFFCPFVTVVGYLGKTAPPPNGRSLHITVGHLFLKKSLPLTFKQREVAKTSRVGTFILLLQDSSLFEAQDVAFMTLLFTSRFYTTGASIRVSTPWGREGVSNKAENSGQRREVV